jgi:hypothetical protein
LKCILFGPQGRLRNGWWVLVFIAVFLLSRVLYSPVSQELQAVGLSKASLAPLPFVFALLVTWVCTRLRGEPLASVGFWMATPAWKARRDSWQPPAAAALASTH